MSLMGGGEQKQHTEALVVHITLSSSKTQHSSRVCFHRETCLWHGACYTLQITFQTEHGFCKNAPSQEICWVKNNFVSIRYYFTYNFSHAHHRQDCFLSQEVSRNSPFNSTREKNPNPLNMEFSLLHYIFFFFPLKLTVLCGSDSQEKQTLYSKNIFTQQAAVLQVLCIHLQL